jgi:hypothetical protein
VRRDGGLEQRQQRPAEDLELLVEPRPALGIFGVVAAKGLQSAIRVLVDAEAGPIRKDVAVRLCRGAVAKFVAR